MNFDLLIWRHMPHYYNYKDHSVFGKITVRPKELCRRLLIGRFSPFRHSTMDTIWFDVDFDKLPDGVDFHYTIAEKMGDGSYRNVCEKAQKKCTISGRADYTGDTKFFVGKSNQGLPTSDQNGEVLFHENILSKEQRFSNVMNIVWGFLIALAAGFVLWLLGLIELVPIMSLNF